MKKLTIIVAMLLAFSVQGIALAAEQFACGSNVRGYAKAEFVVLTGTDVNLRVAPVNGRVLRLLPRHTLMRVLAKQGVWYKVNVDGTVGFVHSDFTGKGHSDVLDEEDFSVGDIVLGAQFSKQEASANFGKLRKTSKKSDRTYYAYKGVTVGVSKRGEKVEYIELKNDEHITLRGACVDDSGALIVGQYGLPDTVVYDNGDTIYEYFADKNTLRFTLNKKGLVEKIVLQA